MKIMFPIGMFYPSQIGGPANAISWMVKALRSQKIKTTVITTNYGINKPIKTGVWHNNIFGDIIYHRFRWMTLPLRLIWTSLIKLPQTDIIHLTSIFHPPSIILAAAACIINKKIVWSPGGELAPGALYYKRYKKLPYLWLVKTFFSNSAIYHSSSPQETLDIQSVMGEKSKIFQIPNLIELEPKINCAKKKQLLFIGRIHPIKGIENLIRAVNNSARFRQSDFKLTIAGDDANEYGNSLKKLVNELCLTEKINFVGHVEGTAKMLLYAESYFFFVPSHAESFGNVVTESLSQATPVVASTGTPWTVLNNAGAGFWLPNDSSTLGHIIDHIIEMDIESYENYSSNAYKLVTDRYEINNSIYKWVQFYQSLTAGSYTSNEYYDL